MPTNIKTSSIKDTYDRIVLVDDDGTDIGAGTATKNIEIQTSGSGTIGVATSTPIHISTNRVGIGVADPDTNLEIGGTAATGVMISSTGTGSNNAYLTFKTNDGGTPKYGMLGFDYTDDVVKMVYGSSFDGTHGIAINSSNRVGIGTFSPAKTLHVSTSDEDVAQFTSTDDTSQILITDDGDTAYFGVSDNGGGSAVGLAYMGFNSGEHANNLNIDANGLVGIGITDPLRLLHLKYAASSATPNGVAGGGAHLLVEAATNAAMEFLTGSHSDSRIWFTDANTAASGGIIYQHHSTPADETLQLRVNESTRVTIEGGGNVGIGTTSPTHTLDVEGSAGIHIWRDDITSPQADMGWSFSIDNSPAGDLRITQTDTHGQNGEEMMRITDTGNVGIGTNVPQVMLHVEGPSSGTASVDIGINNVNILSSHTLGILRFTGTENDYASNYDVGAQITGQATEDWDSTGSGGQLNFYTCPNNSNVLGDAKMIIGQSGKVGIGDTDPAHPFVVAGTSNQYNIVAQCDNITDNNENFIMMAGKKSGGSLRYAGLGVQYTSGTTGSKQDETCGMLLMYPTDGIPNFLYYDDNSVLRHTLDQNTAGRNDVGTTTAATMSDERAKDISTDTFAYGLS